MSTPVRPVFVGSVEHVSVAQVLQALSPYLEEELERNEYHHDCGDGFVAHVFAVHFPGAYMASVRWTLPEDYKGTLPPPHIRRKYEAWGQAIFRQEAARFRFPRQGSITVQANACCVITFNPGGDMPDLEEIINNLNS